MLAYKATFEEYKRLIKHYSRVFKEDVEKIQSSANYIEENMDKLF